MTQVVELADLAAHTALVELLGRVWGVEPPAHIICLDVVRALAQAGNYVVGAYRGDALAGGGIAFLGAGHLHLHIVAVDPPAQGRGIGYVLMRHVRDWAVARGIDEVRWTFDPLVRRNAHFNLAKLGAVATGYLPRFYGALPDAPSEGDDTDRLYVTWHVAGAPAGDPGERGRAGDTGARGRAGDPVLLDIVGDRPVATGVRPAGLARGLVAVPPDIERLRRTDPGLAAVWRDELRRALAGALDAGLVVAGFTPDGRYLLRRPQ